MIKSVILKTLVASSAFAFSSHNAQNRTLPASGGNSVSESSFNEMNDECRPRRRRMTVELYHGGGYVNLRGTFNVKPNKCYSAEPFSSAKMVRVQGNRGAFMVCKEPNCGGSCYVYNMNQGNQINDSWFYIGKAYAVSYYWITPYN
ncbi:hypothetical protein AX774_g3480 [Zancudomyces culisetae]|uniref:Uncharacterized protein n=1 Tax=Zancudomyces culisetae TaxID=1213189 RepID=A0A1R1PPZ3_ZANCU|nr:hypothetical protein AX774_g3480 [Zancudomyces culisetae]|eukprot:OMH83019.1 hypothetical protein AX774_g3480 [Zancudomyces culisetae]